MTKTVSTTWEKVIHSVCCKWFRKCLTGFNSFKFLGGSEFQRWGPLVRKGFLIIFNSNNYVHSIDICINERILADRLVALWLSLGSNIFCLFIQVGPCGNTCQLLLVHEQLMERSKLIQKYKYGQPIQTNKTDVQQILLQNPHGNFMNIFISSRLNMDENLAKQISLLTTCQFKR